MDIGVEAIQFRGGDVIAVVFDVEGFRYHGFVVRVFYVGLFEAAFVGFLDAAFGERF